MMRCLFIAPFSCLNGTERVIKEALKIGAQPHEIFYLTPSPRKLRATQMLFAQIYNQRAFVPPKFFTLRQLALKLTREYDSFRPFPEEIKPLLVRHLFLVEKKRVTIGYAQVVAGFITALKRHLSPEEQIILPERLKKMEIFFGHEKVLFRLLEAHKLMLNYNRELTRLRWADSEDIFTRAPQLLDNIPSIKVLILDSFVAPNRLEKNLLKALIEKAEITFALGYGTPDSDPRYDFASQFTDFILNQPDFSIEILPASHPIPKPPVLRFPNAEEEVINLCHRLREQAERSNLKNTFVVFPRLNEYAALINRIFRQYEIPFTIYPETPLASSPPIIAVIELLSALNTDYERVATTAALSSPFFPNLLRLSKEEKNISARLMLNILSRRAGIIKGKKNWDHIAERIIRSEQLNLEDEEKLFLREVQQAVRQALGLVEKILKSTASLGTQAQRLKQFLETVRYCQNLNPEDPSGSEMVEDRKKLYDILDTIVAFEADFGGHEETRTDFIAIITKLLSQSPKTPEKELQGVIALGMEETLGLTLDHLYFAGLTENALPAAYQPDPLIPEQIKKKLGIPDIDWHRDWQRFHFYRTISSTPNLPWLSFPESRDGNPVLPTPFLQDLESNFSIMTPYSGAEKTVIYSETEHQLYLGKERNVTLEKITTSVDFTNEPHVQEVIARRFGPENYISVTGLEQYLRCPFLFYLERVLGLNTPPEPEYLIDAQQWGIILHEVFSQLYSSSPFLALEELPAAAQGALENVLKKADLPRFWSDVTRQVFHNLLPRFLEQEKTLRQAGFQPEKIEYTLKGTIPPNIKLKGRIDRIDSSGPNLRILDYKTGGNTITANDIVKKRTHLQLPLYALLLPEQEGFKGSGVKVDNIGVYYLRDGKVEWLANGTLLSELIKVAVDNATAVVNAIRMGRFPAQPGEKYTCLRCDLRFTCGHNTETIKQEIGE
ncbi:MAG: PD-(D/E)XK nuclease family protein [bacterium]